ncbi:6-phosphogluconate dehydrogenase [Flavicella sediminum]|uniref:6-phosphogluconate dehydrogenase n=1 Tax=Flavicella sediminum TaxID=2585141 RepID=UPI001123E463|nr:6-phosphogluconate dehydrogenase [Flavicella sediminum]
MKKFLIILISAIIVGVALYITAVYYVTFSEGFRSGELVKVTKKGILFKTWEGEISQGVSESQHFSFSIEKDQERIIDLMKEYQGKFVRLTYKERFATFPWLGDSLYFVIDIERIQDDKEESIEKIEKEKNAFIL